MLRPLIERIKANVMFTDRLHADDTPIQVLDPMVRQTRGKARAIKEGRIWVHVRDDRPWGGKDPPAIAYCFSPDPAEEVFRAEVSNAPLIRSQLLQAG